MNMNHVPFATTLMSIAAAFAAPCANADAVTDWNRKSGDLITEAKLGTPPAARVMAIVQTAALQAIEDAQQRQASAEAALAAAHRVTLTRLLPAQQPAIDAAYQAALNSVADGAARNKGISAGEAAAQAVLVTRAEDGASTPESHRPYTTAGMYVPTAPMAVPQWSQRKPWLMASAAQFRPAPPPALNSEQWVRDFNEVKALGGKAASTRRSAEQTEAARFWEYSLPAIYHGVVQSVAQQPQRDLAQNARLYAAVAQAMDDALIAVFDAKYHYQFWRPATAIRNGDLDGNDATVRDAAWTPLIEAPMHPEYPSGHSILATSVATVLDAEVQGGTMPVLATSSPTAKGTTRRWQRTDDFVREVSDARVHGGIHFRSATNAAEAMGRQIGGLAVQQILRPAP
ncbi:vanadium-dependent haloperoxidase [Aquincola tertiaricarbonis]|uniref:vanadium-dependent haloperoxidase n=1 Tax=Aquincola tertiaricarbonis TaxID=391953 RepID=UPI000AA27392|nr:vanadium-dependent haloperoxidase [Aquincola tertiaricarbonis]